MRNILWRLAAVALAGCVAFLLSQWPEPVEPVEFRLIPDCATSLLEAGRTCYNSQGVEVSADTMTPVAA